MGSNNDYLVSRIDQSIIDINNTLCSCTINVKGCSHINANMTNYSDNCVNMCQGSSTPAISSNWGKYNSDLFSGS